MLNHMHKNLTKRVLVTETLLCTWSRYRADQYGKKRACTAAWEPK
jgi:hypothetical protein